MSLRDFHRTGHTPTLLCALLYFDMSFMVWVLIGALATSIAPDLGLGDSQKGLLVAVPLLGGALMRLVLGVLCDVWGGRRTGLLGLALTLVPLLLGWLWADGFSRLLVVGLLLGIAGASFAVALPLASRWYPPEHQGLALGIAGAGNSGTALATLVAPRLAEAVGWRGVFGCALVPVAVTLAIFYAFARDSPRQPPRRSWSDYARVLRAADTWWFSWFYSVTFGGFVGLASFLSLFFRDQYGLSPVRAGLFATVCVLAGSFLRPVGGHLADRFGGAKLLTILFALAAACLAGMVGLPPYPTALALFFLGMGLLGMGNGAVFQIVPLRFRDEIGVVTGIIGAAGGLGGFVLPSLLGMVKQTTGSFAGGFAAFAAAAAVSAVLLARRNLVWSRAEAEALPSTSG